MRKESGPVVVEPLFGARNRLNISVPVKYSEGLILFERLSAGIDHLRCRQHIKLVFDANNFFQRNLLSSHKMP